MTAANTQNTSKYASADVLLAQVSERLQGQLLRGERIASLLQERSGSLTKEGPRSRVQGIEPFAKTEAVELVTSARANTQ